MIPLTIKASGAVMLSDELRQRVEQKFSKISQLLEADASARADAELSTTGGARTGEQFRAEFNIVFAGGFVRAEATRATMHAAIDEAADEARREVRKHRTRHRDLMRRGAAKVKDFFKYWSGS